MSEPQCKCRQLQSTEIDTEDVAEFLAERAGKAIAHYGGQECRDMLGKLTVTEMP